MIDRIREQIQQYLDQLLGEADQLRKALAALANGQAMTASEVAAKAGLGRATVSTTLSKLAKSGEVQKAQRGYQLAPTASPAPSSPAK